jgi:hypothetical protein
MANRAELLKKIQARKAEKQAAAKAKWAKMRHVADEGAAGVESSLSNLAEACAAQAEAFDNLKENLDLIQAPKEASLKVRTAAARNYAKSFKRIAEEAPEQLAEAICEAYHSLDEQAGAIESLAQNLGVDLNASPAEEAFGQEGLNEIGQDEEQGIPVGEGIEEEIKEGAGEGWTTDRDETGQPKTPEKVDVPRVANSGPGAAGFVTDRNNEGKPEAPKKVEIPQAQGEAVNASKAGHVRPMKQIVSPGTPSAAGAEEFVKNIPQAQGKGETPGNKAAAKGR